MNLALQQLHYDYCVRLLNESDILSMLQLAQYYPTYYQDLGKPLSLDGMKKELYACPTDIKHKYFVGFFNADKLIAMLEFILNYPDKDTVLLGFLMIDKTLARQSLGTQIYQNLERMLKELGYTTIILSCHIHHHIAKSFWLKQGFIDNDEYDDDLLVLEKPLNGGI